MEHRDYMARAIALSRSEMRDKGMRPFAAVIVKDGEIVAEACNDVLASHDPTGHGEVRAIRAAAMKLATPDLSGCVMYSTAEPCAMCAAVVWWSRLDKLYYGVTLDDCAAIGIHADGLIEEVSRPIKERKLPSEQLLHDEANAVLQEWSRTPGFRTF